MSYQRDYETLGSVEKTGNTGAGTRHSCCPYFHSLNVCIRHMNYYLNIASLYSRGKTKFSYIINN